LARVRPAEITEELNDLWRLVVGYAKQETAAPLRGVLDFIRYGIVGMTLFAIGAGFAAITIVRALQTEFHAFDGNWSFVPYLASIAGSGIVLGLAIRSVARTPWKSDTTEGNAK
jgi:hypothetical protein